jgi:hypothetical protein
MLFFSGGFATRKLITFVITLNCSEISGTDFKQVDKLSV